MRWVLASFSLSIIIVCLVIFGTEKLVNKRIAESEKPKPHFSLFLNTSDFPHLDLPLTNDFLVTKKTNNLVPEDRPGVLVVPLPPGHSDVALDFWVLNNSSETAELAEMEFNISNELKCTPHPAWERFKRGEPDALMGVYIRAPRAMLPYDIHSLPSLIFPLRPFVTNGRTAVIAGPVWFRVRCKDTPYSSLLFNIAVHHGTNGGKPFVAKVKPKKTGTTVFQFDQFSN